MREILFRGKRVDNGEWVEGFYSELPIGSLAATIFSNDDEIVCEDTASYIVKVLTKQHSNYSNGCPLEVVECEQYEVVPETIGQYTGSTDKNGKKIFEGDIVSDTVDVYTVVFDEQCKFMMTGEYDRFLVHCDEDCFVLGNVFDNPELLEVGK